MQYQSEAMRYFSYIVECSNGSLYAGWTSDLEKRLQQHNAGKGAKYTRALRPVVLRASWEFASKSEAMSHEWHIKQLSREKKMQLIQAGPCEEFELHTVIEGGSEALSAEEKDCSM